MSNNVHVFNLSTDSAIKSHSIWMKDVYFLTLNHKVFIKLLWLDVSILMKPPWFVHFFFFFFIGASYLLFFFTIWTVSSLSRVWTGRLSDIPSIVDDLSMLDLSILDFYRRRTYGILNNHFLCCYYHKPHNFVRSCQWISCENRWQRSSITKTIKDSICKVDPFEHWQLSTKIPLVSSWFCSLSSGCIYLFRCLLIAPIYNWAKSPFLCARI